MQINLIAYPELVFVGHSTHGLLELVHDSKHIVQALTRQVLARPCRNWPLSVSRLFVPHAWRLCKASMIIIRHIYTCARCPSADGRSRDIKDTREGLQANKASLDQVLVVFTSNPVHVG